MKSWYKISFVLLLVVIFLHACDDKEPDYTNIYYDDTPYEVELAYRYPAIEVDEDNKLTQAKVDLGRKLFYEEKISKSKTMSCGTCHKQGFAFTENSSKSDNDLGNETKRNASALFNLAWVNKGLFWDGRANSLEEAIEDAVNNEQHPEWDITLSDLKEDSAYVVEFQKAFIDGEINRPNINKAIASFLRIIISKDSKFDKYIRGQVQLTPLEQYGLDSLFITEKGDCFHCHDNYPFMSSFNFHDNGVQDVVYTDLGLGAVTGNSFDNGKMRPPSLRNLSFSAPYMHDGRFATLEEVVDFYSEGLHQTPNVDPLMKQVNQGGLQLDENHVLPDGTVINQKEALIAFLKTLDDTVFINNEEYKKPF